MIDMTELIDDWAILLDAKYDFAYAEDMLNMEEYLDLVEKSYDAIKEFYAKVDGLKKVLPHEIMEYMNLLEEISMYAAPCYVDESENNTFALSRIIAEELAALAANYNYAKEDEEIPFKEGVLSSVTGFDYEIERVLYYDVKEKDTSDFSEVAKAIGF